MSIPALMLLINSQNTVAKAHSVLDWRNKAPVLPSILPYLYPLSVCHYTISPAVHNVSTHIYTTHTHAHTHTITTHTVPLAMHNSGDRKYRQLSHDPGLSDVAPTVLDLMGLEIPKEISGQSLLEKK